MHSRESEICSYSYACEYAQVKKKLQKCLSCSAKRACTFAYMVKCVRSAKSARTGEKLRGNCKHAAEYQVRNGGGRCKAVETMAKR
ncbi:hypothetical protein POVWA2_027920 [Plasmodium ovale wallikeri]|uniref:Uncharacterized protein n=1 Tax=Plasmodium ovale wallikeri TaxID=864142 RepID=A0A1A8YV67_PLAOA|nr:hypothetical protein POVWA1_028040 [Plasmodium ovale wallikeri]SBT36036.1 hypothetical protein POVWA2_027920 [Plasmodium ovale wallikeri]